MSLRQLQEQVAAHLAPYGYWPELANLARLTEEVGELARELNHRYGPKRKKADESDNDLGLEMADILFVLAALANQTGVDLEAAFAATLVKYEQRDAGRWPRRPEA